jgi:hypothetical protein
MPCPGGADPYAILGVLIAGTVQTLVEHIPEERRAETPAKLKQLLEQQLEASGVSDGDGRGLLKRRSTYLERRSRHRSV